MSPVRFRYPLPFRAPWQAALSGLPCFLPSRSPGFGDRVFGQTRARGVVRLFFGLVRGDRRGRFYCSFVFLRIEHG